MANKKGFMRIVEAIIAIMIIVGSLLVLSVQKETRMGRDLTEILPPFLEEAAENPSLRKMITQDYEINIGSDERENSGVLVNVEDFLKEKIRNPGLELSVSICGLNGPCPIKKWPGDFEVYSAERIVSTTISDAVFSPRKLKVFLWRAG
ncbi:MAG: hypothetical protein ABIG28_03330 [archaeon]